MRQRSIRPGRRVVPISNAAEGNARKTPTWKIDTMLDSSMER